MCDSRTNKNLLCARTYKRQICLFMNVICEWIVNFVHLFLDLHMRITSIIQYLHSVFAS